MSFEASEWGVDVVEVTEEVTEKVPVGLVPRGVEQACDSAPSTPSDGGQGGDLVGG